MSCNEYKEYVLSDLIEIIGGGTPKTTVAEYWNGNINWISIKDFNGDNKYITNTEKTITELGLNKSSTKLLKEKDIIISARGTVGAVGVIKRPMAFNQSCYGLRAKEVVDSDFLYYLLKNTVNILKSNTHGSVFDTITKDTFKNITVKIPQKYSQEIIAKLLSTLDEKIELNNEMNKTLEEMAKILYKRWFVDFEFPNEDGEPYKSSGGEMVESELGMLPKGWKNGTLGEMINVTSGKRPKKKQSVKTEEYNIPLIGASTIMGYVNEVLYDEKLLVIGRVGTHGVVQRINYPSWPSDNTLVIKTDKTEFVYQILNIIDYSSLNRGSTQPLITQGDIKEYKIIIPELHYLNEYEIMIGSLYSIVEANISENIELTQIRDSLLPKLLSGEIRVEDIEANL